MADDPLATLAPTTNAFTANVSGARAVTLDGTGMKLNAPKVITGTVTTSDPLSLTLTGNWHKAPRLLVDGLPATGATRGAKANTVTVPAGMHTITYVP